MLATFAGSANYTPSQSAVTFTIAKAVPTVTAAEAGWAYNGFSYPATAMVAGVVSGWDTTPSARVEDIAPTLTYCSAAGGSGSATPPSAPVPIR